MTMTKEAQITIQGTSASEQMMPSVDKGTGGRPAWICVVFGSPVTGLEKDHDQTRL